jgi:hypothetical protein
MTHSHIDTPATNGYVLVNDPSVIHNSDPDDTNKPPEGQGIIGLYVQGPPSPHDDAGNKP